MATARGTRIRNGTVSESAVRGTSARLGKQPSFTCCLRQGSSSSTTRTSARSAKSQTGGSMKARWPFSPIPRMASDGPACRSSAA